MELYHLKSFVAVARERKLTRAADKLCLSQPAVSAHIKTLEDELGVLLFNRTHRGMQLTEEGALLKQHAEIALRTIAALQLQAKTFGGRASEIFKLGIHMDARLLKISELLSVMSQKSPFVELQFHKGMSWNIIERVKTDEIDGGFAFGSADGKEIRCLTLQTSDVFIVGPSQWKDRMAKADMVQISRLPWIWSPEPCPFNGIASNLFREMNLKPFKVAVADHQTTHHALVSAGVGLTLMVAGEARATEKSDSIIIWGEPVGRVALQFVYPANRENDSTMQAILEGLEAVWNLSH